MINCSTTDKRPTPLWLPMAVALTLYAGTASATAIPTTGGIVSSGFTPLSAFSSNPVDIGFQLDFYGRIFSQLYINANGNVTFGSPLASSTPFGFTASTTPPIIAPFFADSGQFSGGITYGQGTYGTGSDQHRAFVVNWPGLSCGQSGDLSNMFQLLLVRRADTPHPGDFDIRFNYDLQCPNPDYVGPLSPIDIGYANGGVNGLSSTYYQISQLSGVQSAYTDPQTTGYTGGFLFPIRSDGLNQLTESVPEPATVALFGLGLLCLAGLRRRTPSPG